jgi:hypothetical protein
MGHARYRARRAGAISVIVAVTVAGSAALGAEMVPAAAERSAAAGVEAAQELLAFIPSDHRRWCSRVDPETFADGNFGDPGALVVCSDPAVGVASVAYARYDDPAEALARYQSAIPAGLPESDGSSTDCPSQGTWHFPEAPDETVGSDACSIGTQNGRDIATMAWTYDAEGILGLAFNDRADGAALKQWWNDFAGPLQQPEVDDEFASVSRAVRREVGTRLAESSPAVVKTCELRGVDVGEYGVDEPEWSWLPWLHGSATCRTAGKGRVDYFQLNGDDVADFAADYRTYLTDDEYPSTPHPATCETAKPLVRRGGEVGKIVCWYYQKTLWALWYDEERGTVGTASIPRLTARQLLTYLERNKLT